MNEAFAQRHNHNLVKPSLSGNMIVLNDAAFSMTKKDLCKTLQM